MHRQRSMINEKKSFDKFLTSTKNNSKIKFASTIIVLNQKKQQIRKDEGNYAFSESFEKKKKTKKKIKKKKKKYF